MTDQALGTTSVRDAAQQLGAEVSKAFVGNRGVVDELIISLLAGGHVMLEGVPGLGKTLLAKAIARAVDGKFSRIQFTPDLMPSDVSGHAVFDSKAETFRIRRGPVFANFLLADEINRAPAKTQSALLEVMQERQVTIEGKSIQVDEPFMTIATQNPVEHEGTYPLPEAQLDRFLLKVLIDYSDHASEMRIVSSVVSGKIGDALDVSNVNVIMTVDDLITAQRSVAKIRVDEAVMDYAVRIVRATRQTSGIRLGAGTRGSISIIRAARAAAALEGRDFVIPDDVRKVATPALRHRISLAAELEIEAYRPDDVLQELLKNVEAPRQ